VKSTQATAIFLLVSTMSVANREDEVNGASALRRISHQARQEVGPPLLPNVCREVAHSIAGGSLAREARIRVITLESHVGEAARRHKAAHDLINRGGRDRRQMIHACMKVWPSRRSSHGTPASASPSGSLLALRGQHRGAGLPDLLQAALAERHQVTPGQRRRQGLTWIPARGRPRTARGRGSLA
jgi:hypothetical protein